MPSHKKNHNHHRSSPLPRVGDAADGTAASQNSLTKEPLTLAENSDNARETLTLTESTSNARETPVLTRTPGHASLADNSRDEEILPEGAVHANSESLTLSGDTDHACFRHGNGADAEGTHCNGENGNHHHRHQQLSVQEKIENLKQLNQNLLKEVSSSRSAQAELDVKIKALQDDLEENNMRGDALLMEKNWLENQKLQFELDLASSRKESAKLALEKQSLVAEKQALLASKQGLERDLSVSEGKLKEIFEKLQESIKTLDLAEKKAQLLNSELERTRSNEHCLNGEINTLQMLNSDMQSDLRDLQLKKNSLDNELSVLHNARAVAESQVGEANQVIEALQAELFSRGLEREGFQMQLKEAWQQIASLEAQQEARIAREIDLGRQVHHLEKEIIRVRGEHEDTSQSFNQEREAKLSLKSLLDTAEGKHRGLEGELHTMSSSVVKLQTDTNGYQQQISSLESQVSSLANEKAMLEETNVSLEEKLRQLNSRSEKASLEAEGEIEKLKALLSELEQGLVVAKADATVGDKTVCQLKVDLKEMGLLLKKKAKLMEVSLPLAVMSTGSLVGLGILVFCRRSK